MTVLPLYAALGAFVASAIQAAVALSQMREDERDVIDHWGARDELRSEVSWTHPIKRWRRGRDIKRLIDAEEDPIFRRRFWRVRSSLLSWVMLVVASAYGAVAALLD